MNKKILAVLSLITIIISTLSGCYFFPEEEEILAPPVVKASDVTYTTITAKKKNLIKQVINSGNIISGTEFEAAFVENSGAIRSINVHAGDIVEKGELLAELETYDLDYQIKNQQLKTKKAQLTYDIAVEKKLSSNEIDKAKIDIQLEQNNLDKLNQQLEASRLYAEIGGTVSFAENLQPGDWINAERIIVRIIDDADLYVQLYPSDYTIYAIDMEVSIRFENELFAGKITKTPIEAIANGEDNTKAVTVQFADSAPNIASVGTLADVILIQDQRIDVIVIAKNLIKTVDEKKVVYLLRDNIKVEQAVELGLETGSEIEITSGLQVGDQIIIR